MKLLVFPSESLETYWGSGYVGWFPKYFNPEDLFETIVVCQRESQPNPELHRGMVVYSVPDIPAGGAFFLALNGLWSCLRQKPDLIRAYNPLVSGLCAVACQKLFGIPAIVSIHTHYGKLLDWAPRFSLTRLLGRYTIRLVLRLAKEIWVPSTALVSYALAQGASGDKIRVVPNKVDIKHFSRQANHSLQKSAFTFLYVGRLVPAKNVQAILEAVMLLKKESVPCRVVLIGKGAMEETLTVYVKTHGLQEIVEFRGTVSHLLLPEAMAEADAFILPSWHEGFGTVLIEAQAAGLPIIASDIVETKDIVGPHNALLFPPQDPMALAKRMKSLMTDQELQGRLKKLSRESAESFSHETVSALESRSYRALLERAP